MGLILDFTTRTAITQKSVPSIPSRNLHLQCVCPKSKLQWGLTFSQVVWLLGLLNCSNCTKSIHEIGIKT
eukprot:1148078-Pelagomonas_calceolata.AAC.1